MNEDESADRSSMAAAQDEPASGWSTVKTAWNDPNRWMAAVVAAAPSVAFVAVDAATSLNPAIVAAGAAAVLGLGVQVVRRRPIRSALIGILVVAVCAVVAAVTGEAKGFFLLPTLIPFAVIVICSGSILARRPLTGLLLNRVTGGPRDWDRHPGLRRVHLTATGAAIAINVANAAVQATFYHRGNTVVLAAAHAATGPVFGTLVAVTVVAVRTTLAADQRAH